ncbi:hypothetical protein HBI56_012830 [Parastagonospora nodorum]|uniref:Uncharacterized protein n=1 Tax=Phaeosphaeria nodorum (strain SN15 / ATCC MYA-4574 / FGSC 10173) TaxID=321614 RepID=A0A7U2HUC6_PHANO|nr:hypothetical protein HBH56_008770 [Parastagonospora nodorum]QRC90614.1 hypothetical protein JI435_001380 [Parastagonospora nodorum SN15]KAH3922158.1 hypothetical protein HBH54_227030 [Parastagonospora nodorum]KAH3939335.1 hypothetical protein HBH53_236430 [Parastagonospora nodorum]KAH3986770.1 hypothetical protein HBH51_014520 [Parastagonospora nodorum]
MISTTFTIALLTALAAASPAALSARQGGYFVSVGNKYSGKGCNPNQLIFADPIFGNGNVCQPLDRFGDGGAINSYETLSVSAGCSVEIYTGPDCTGTAFSAPVGGCVTGNSAFVSTFVTCPST